MSFGRRLAFFFILIALVPTLALAGMLVIVSEDSRQGKADARLASALETALALYDEQVGDAGEEAAKLAGDPRLGAGVASGDQGDLEDFVTDAARGDQIEAVQVLDEEGEPLDEAGSDQAIAFAGVPLASEGETIGTLRVSVATASEFSAEVQRLTGSDLVITRGDEALSATVEPPDLGLEPGETADAELPEGDFRARLLTLDPVDEETLLLLGPRKEGGFFAIDRPAALVLVGFLMLGVVFSFALARALTGLHSQVAEQAITDPLTGLSNRRRMWEMLEREVYRAMRFDHPLSFLILDVDEFKSINDERGHPQGDAVLKWIADLVRESTRAIDITARYGGDEFALVLLETDEAGAQVLADRLREDVSGGRAPVGAREALQVTISVGVASVPTSATTVDGLVEAADQALLRAKREGKNRTKAAPRTASKGPEAQPGRP